MEISLREVSLFEKSDIQYKIRVGKSRLTSYKEIVVVKFSGTYRPGAIGSDDSALMLAIAEAAWTITQPLGGILDLRELTYSSGDDLDWIQNFSPNANWPCATLHGKKCSSGIKSLFEIKSWDEEETFFEDFEDAWVYVEQEMDK